jgi:hypothetical protein
MHPPQQFQQVAIRRHGHRHACEKQAAVPLAGSRYSPKLVRNQTGPAPYQEFELTRSVADGPAAAVVRARRMSLPGRILGVLVRPRAAFHDIVAAPRWLGVMIVTTVAAALSGALLMQTAVGRQALVDQWERTAIAFGQEVDDARYAQLQDMSRSGAIYAAATAAVTGPGLTFALAGLLLAALGGRRSGVSFRQVLAVVAFAAVIPALRQVIAAPLSYLRETTASPTALGVWFPMLDEASPVARFLGALDVFVLWWLVVLAIGVGVLYDRRARTITATLVGIYAALALLMAIAMALTGGAEA